MMVTTGGRVTVLKTASFSCSMACASIVLLNLIFEADDRALGSEVAGHVAGQIFAERLVDGGEDAASQQARDQILGADVELLRQDPLR
jgi:hypothetical protein